MSADVFVPVRRAFRLFSDVATVAALAVDALVDEWRGR